MSTALLWLLAAILCSSTANILLKQASRGEGLAAYLTPAFLGGAVILALGLIAYLRALQTIPISTGYPMLVGSTMIVTTLAALWVYQERITFGQVCGAGLVLAGIVLLVQRGSAL